MKEIMQIIYDYTSLQDHKLCSFYIWIFVGDGAGVTQRTDETSRSLFCIGECWSHSNRRWILFGKCEVLKT